jgi:hypothetical protein
MAREDEARRGENTVALFLFEEPESGWTLMGAAEFFLELSKIAIDISMFERTVAIEVATSKMASLSAAGFPLDEAQGELNEAVRQTARSFGVELLGFRFNSPIEVALKFAGGLSVKTVKTVFAAFDYIAYREVNNRRKHAEASSIEEDVEAKKLKNFQTALKIHQNIENPELRDKFQVMLEDKLSSLVDRKIPRLKEIKIIDAEMMTEKRSPSRWRHSQLNPLWSSPSLSALKGKEAAQIGSGVRMSLVADTRMP